MGRSIVTGVGGRCAEPCVGLAGLGTGLMGFEKGSTVKITLFGVNSGDIGSKGKMVRGVFIWGTFVEFFAFLAVFFFKKKLFEEK